ncbi:MAG TPA: hypothetical protein VG753_02985 [Candidatus Paceibacterota bacterium]|nr:hypothetical protein [Candidatus Paceibacterota bacterium]
MFLHILAGAAALALSSPLTSVSLDENLSSQAPAWVVLCQDPQEAAQLLDDQAEDIPGESLQDVAYDYHGLIACYPIPATALVDFDTQGDMEIFYDGRSLTLWPAAAVVNGIEIEGLLVRERD